MFHGISNLSKAQAEGLSELAQLLGAAAIRARTTSPTKSDQSTSCLELSENTLLSGDTEVHHVSLPQLAKE